MACRRRPESTHNQSLSIYSAAVRYLTQSLCGLLGLIHDCFGVLNRNIHTSHRLCLCGHWSRRHAFALPADSGPSQVTTSQASFNRPDSLTTSRIEVALMTQQGAKATASTLLDANLFDVAGLIRINYSSSSITASRAFPIRTPSSISTPTARASPASKRRWRAGHRQLGERARRLHSHLHRHRADDPIGPRSRSGVRHALELRPRTAQGVHASARTDWSSGDYRIHQLHGTAERRLLNMSEFSGE